MVDNTLGNKIRDFSFHSLLRPATAQRLFKILGQEKPELQTYIRDLLASGEAPTQKQIRDVLNEAADDDPDNAEIYDALRDDFTRLYIWQSQADILTRIAKNLCDLQYYQTTLIFIDLALILSPDAVELYHHKTLAHILLGEHKHALNSIREALNADYDNSVTHQYEGLVFYSQEQYEDALSCLRKAISLDANNDQAHYYIGSCFSQQEKWSKAISHFQKTLRTL